MRNCMIHFKQLLDARIECIWVQTHEEGAFVDDLRTLLREVTPRMRLSTWSSACGLKEIPLSPAQIENPPDTQCIPTFRLFQEIQKSQNPTLFNEEISLTNPWDIFVLLDLHIVMRSESLVRRIRDLKEYQAERYTPIVVVSPIVDIPLELEKLFTVYDYDLPTQEDISNIIYSIRDKFIRKAETQRSRYDAPIYAVPNEETCQQVIRACKGLTEKEIIRACARSFTTRQVLDPSAISVEKQDIVKKSGVLNIINPEISFGDIGGNQLFKDYAQELLHTFMPPARSFGIVPPSGCILFGIPGTSKTMAAHAFADLLQLPLLSLSMSKIMDQYVGQSERKMAQALRIAKAIAPCVMLWDEVEKAFGGGYASGFDNGSIARVFAECLSFLNEDNDVFVVMTANDPSKLPPEFTRSGRLDSQWFFDLPMFTDRVDIFKICLSKAGHSLPDKDIHEAARQTADYTGAEINTTVNIALRKAFCRNILHPNLELADILSAKKEVIPIVVSAAEQIEVLRNYARGRARFASNPKKEEEDILKKIASANAKFLCPESLSS